MDMPLVAINCCFRDTTSVIFKTLYTSRDLFCGMHGF